MKKLCLPLACLLILLMLTGCGRKSEHTAVIVDGVEISVSEMECFAAATIQSLEVYGQTLLEWGGETEGEPTDAYIRRQALSIAVNYHAAELHAAELSLSLSDEEQKNIDERLKADIEGMGTEDYRSFLENEHYTEDFYRYYFYEIPYLQEKLFQGLYGEGGMYYPGDDEIRWHFNEQYFNVSYLLLSTIDDQSYPLEGEEREAQREIAAGLLERALAGVDFEQIADESGNYMLAANPGFVMALGQVSPEFDEALLRLDVSEISGLVDTPYGFYILKRLPDDPSYCEENMDSIRYDYCWALFNALSQEWERGAAVETTESYNKLDVAAFAR